MNAGSTNRNADRYVIRYKDLSGQYFNSWTGSVNDAEEIYRFLLAREDKKRISFIDAEKSEIIKSFRAC